MDERRRVRALGHDRRRRRSADHVRPAPQHEQRTSTSRAFPDHVQVSRYRDVDIQEILASGALMLTDYSSNAFEMAYIQRPVVYFQFDRTAFFAGGHVYRQGTWSYDDDGFGPVAVTASAAIDEVERLIDDGLRPRSPFAERMEREFPFRDGQSCERVYQADRRASRSRSRTTTTACWRRDARGVEPVGRPMPAGVESTHTRRRQRKDRRSTVAVFETSPEPRFGDEPRTILDTGRELHERPHSRLLLVGHRLLRTRPYRRAGRSGRAPPAPVTRTACRRRRVRESQRRSGSGSSYTP